MRSLLVFAGGSQIECFHENWSFSQPVIGSISEVYLRQIWKVFHRKVGCWMKCCGKDSGKLSAAANQSFQIEVKRWGDVCFLESLASLLKHHHQLAWPTFVFAPQCLLELRSLFLLTGVTIFAKLRATDGARHRRDVFLFGRIDGRDRTAGVHVRSWVRRSDHHFDSAQMCCDRRSPQIDSHSFPNYGTTRLWNQRSFKGKIVEHCA